MVHQTIHSPWIGEIAWDSNCEILFPHGLPGFEAERRLIPVEIPAQRPLVYLQSLENPAVCFLCLPVLTIDPAFELHLSDDDRSALELPDGFGPALGADVLCLAFLVPSGRTVETNLSAPIVINLHNSRGAQSVGTRKAESRSAAFFRLGDDGLWEAVC